MNDKPYIYTYEDIERFVTALSVVADPGTGASDREVWERLMTIKVSAEGLAKEMDKDQRERLGRINWLEHFTESLTRYAASMAEHYRERT